MTTPIQDGMRVRAWLEDPLMDGILKSVAANIYNEFREADSSEKRVTTWAKAKALEAIINEMQAVVSAGEREKLESDKRAPKPKEF